MAPVDIAGVNLSLLTGPLILGYMWSYCLYGMLIVQVYLYFEAFPKDRVGIKPLVWAMFILETVFTVFTTIAAWNSYGPGWGDINTLQVIDWSWEPLPALNAVLAAMAQSFYIWRIWNLINALWLPISIGCVMLTQVIGAFYFGIRVAIEGRGVTHLFALWPEVTLWLTGSAACDVLITISLVYLLSRQKRATKFRHTSGLINRLIRFSVETGSVTSCGAFIEVVLWLSCRQWNFHYIFFLILGRLYSNMLMATLNCRASISQGDSPTMITVPQSSFWAETGNNDGGAANPNLSSRGGVQISRTTRVTDDRDVIVMTDFSSTPNATTAGKGIEASDKSYSRFAV